MARLHTTRALLFASLGLFGGCGGSGNPADDGNGPGGNGPGAVCPAGEQDDNADGVCHPDCSQTGCSGGTCSIDSEGLAECTCDPGFQGEACDQLIVPDASNVAFWADALDATTLAGNNILSSWPDKSPNAYAGSGDTKETSPVLVEGELNGLPVVRFDGTDDGVYFPDITAITNTSYTVFVVAKTKDDGGNGPLLHGDAANDSFEITSGSYATRIYHEPDGSSADAELLSDNYGDAGYTAGQWHMFTAQVSSTEIAIWMDGNYKHSLEREDSSLITETMTFWLGKDGGNLWSGDIAEVIVVSDDLHYGERAVYENYLGAKWFGAAFERTPSAFGSPMIWLDASQSGNVTTAGSKVTAWTNLGIHGGYFNNGAFPSAQPELVPAGLGGLPVVRFDGADAMVLGDYGVPHAGVEGEYTIFAVVVPPTSGTTEVLFRANDNEDQALQFDLNADASVLQYNHRWPAGPAGGDALAPTFNPSEPLLVKIERFDGGNYHMLVNGVETTSVGGNGGAIKMGEPLDWVLGGESLAAPGSAFAGDIAEFIVLGSTLGNAEETALAELLRAKWGL